MKPDDREQLQDYLDDRMSEAERSSFEARLADDPRLASRLVWHRSIAGDLRAPAELSPGFYTRARARFEAAQGNGRRRWPWLRWEVVGLAGVALVAAAIFLPGVLREDPALVPEAGSLAEPSKVAEPADRGSSSSEAKPTIGEEEQPPPPASPAAGSQRADMGPVGAKTQEPERAKQAPPVSPGLQDAPRGADDQRAAQEGDAGRDAGEAAPEEVAETASEVAADKRATAPAESPARFRDEKPEAAPGPTPLRDEEDSFAPSPEPPPEAARKEAGAGRRAATLKGLSTSANFSALPSGEPAVVVELPPGVLVEGERRIVDDAESWDALLRGSLAASADLLGDYRDDRRLVLIGAGTAGVRCETLRVREVDAGSVWLLVRRGGNAAGCAARLADDGREIQVVWVENE